jgi:hypothetical protein
MDDRETTPNAVQEDPNLVGEGLLAFCYILCGLSMVLAVGAGVWTYVN